MVILKNVIITMFIFPNMCYNPFTYITSIKEVLMPRGRRKVEIPMMEVYTNELTRLTMLEKEMVLNLESCRAEIKKYKDLILQEEIKELKAIIEDKNISFEEVKVLLENHKSSNPDE